MLSSIMILFKLREYNWPLFLKIYRLYFFSIFGDLLQWSCSDDHNKNYVEVQNNSSNIHFCNFSYIFLPGTVKMLSWSPLQYQEEAPSVKNLSRDFLGKQHWRNILSHKQRGEARESAATRGLF